MDSNLNVGAMVIRGSVIWDDTTQRENAQWLCAGYIAVEEGGSFTLDVSARRAYIYLKANGLSHPIA
eukprot:CAMPEP_0170150048 /NCGR_PEP_ID=MMETSP0033_2-20121228/45032_1 /TAXON_ID=195969 /ORGANISM="Dolichomastix tenuilepis, Strain CCMP3274" /LENGTH=66 /DNA_ID=CAMNT_0010387047 /DNA_START=49 /DNA_END=245 /DNA_ORIENTATION=-